MKKYIIILLLLCSNISIACDYTDPSPFPSNLTLGNGDSLCINYDLVTPWASVAVQSGGKIIISSGSTLRVRGSLTVYPGGKVLIMDCGSKLEVFGTYNGGYQTCEIDVYCDTCDNGNMQPFELIWGSKIWDEWCCVEALPVELIDFEGQNMGYHNMLRWTTASEINNDYFTLERSVDAVSWQELYEVSGTNGYHVQHYIYMDYGIDTTYYYRLKQTDFNGTVNYLKVEIITFRGDVSKKLIFTVNINGQFVDPNYKGLVLKVYSDGTVEKIKQ